MDEENSNQKVRYHRYKETVQLTPSYQVLQVVSYIMTYNIFRGQYVLYIRDLLLQLISTQLFSLNPPGQGHGFVQQFVINWHSIVRRDKGPGRLTNLYLDSR